MSTLSRFTADAERHHAEQVAAGKHDRACEWGPRVYTSQANGLVSGLSFNHMCHCLKRHRIALGFTELPGEIEWRNPCCPTCYEELDGDGDSWTCDSCHVSWGSRGTNAHWTDDYGDLGEAVS